MYKYPDRVFKLSVQEGSDRGVIFGDQLTAFISMLITLNIHECQETQFILEAQSTNACSTVKGHTLEKRPQNEY